VGKIKGAERYLLEFFSFCPTYQKTFSAYTYFRKFDWGGGVVGNLIYFLHFRLLSYIFLVLKFISPILFAELARPLSPRTLMHSAWKQCFHTNVFYIVLPWAKASLVCAEDVWNVALDNAPPISVCQRPEICNGKRRTWENHIGSTTATQS
jgi:hypothetical protein